MYLNIIFEFHFCQIFEFFEMSLNILYLDDFDDESEDKYHDEYNYKDNNSFFKKTN